MKYDFNSLKNAAKQTDLIEFLSSQHPDLIAYDRAKKRYTHPEHDSVVIDPDMNKWWQFSTGDHGDGIDYLIKFAGMQWLEAATELSKYCNIYVGNDDYDDIQTIQGTKKKYKKNKYEKPVQAENNENIIEYLTQKRGLSKEIIIKLINEKKLYEDIHGNCVFYRSEPDFCILRGTGKQTWKGILQEDDFINSFWFFNIGTEKTLFIAEAPIDALSFYECTHKNGIYCAMGGLKHQTFFNILSQFKADDETPIYLITDWDEPGLKFAATVNLYQNMKRATPAQNEQKICKDWNEVLQLRLKTSEMSN